MPGKNVSSAAPLTSDEIKLRDELRADVEMLGGQIGERNLNRYPQLQAAAEFIESSFARAGLQPQRDSYTLSNLVCHNIAAEITGSPAEIVVIGTTIRFSARPARMTTAAASQQRLSYEQRLGS